MEQALLELVKTGVPLARTAIIGYYAYWTLTAVLTTVGIVGVAGMGYHLVKRWQDYVMGLNR